MTQIVSGIFKRVVANKQTALGAVPSPTGAQVLRRVTSTIDLKKAFYESQEIRTSMQVSDGRQGVNSVDGRITGELSSGSYADFMSSVLRADWSAAVISGPESDLTFADVGGVSGTITSAGAATFLADGVKTGMVVTMSGWAETVLNARNFMVTSVTETAIAGVFLDGQPLANNLSGDTVTITEAGKHCYVPTSGHTRDYWGIEHSFTDSDQSELFRDCVIAGMNIRMPATGMATVEFPVMGLSMDTATGAGAPYFTSPTAPVDGRVFAAANGRLMVNGTVVALLTSLDINVDGQFSAPGGVVGSNYDPDVFPGMLKVTGTATVLFSDATMRNLFLTEAEASIVCAMTTDQTATAAVQSWVMPRVKFSGADKDDGEKGLIMTMPFVALENTTGGDGKAAEATTIWIQDSGAA